MLTLEEFWIKPVKPANVRRVIKTGMSLKKNLIGPKAMKEGLKNYRTGRSKKIAGNDRSCSAYGAYKGHSSLEGFYTMPTSVNLTLGD